MLINSILLLFLIAFSGILFFINNLYIVINLLFLGIILSFLLKVRLPIYLPFVIILIINFLFNLFLANYYESLLVSLRLLTMFIVTNIVIKKIGIYHIGYIIGKCFHSKNLSVIIMISLSFIPLMMKELGMIRKSLITKNFCFNLKNVIKKPSVFVVTFFTNLFKKVDELEKVLQTKGLDE